MRVLLVLFLLGLSTPVWAQPRIELSFGTGAEPEKTVTKDCGASIPLTWTVTVVSGTLCDDLEIWATRGSCGDAPAAGDLEIAGITLTTQNTGTVNVEVSELPAFTATDGGVACGAANQEVEHKICAALEWNSFLCGSGNAVARAVTPGIVSFDSKPPAAPTITKVQPLDARLTVSVSTAADTSGYRVEHRATSADAGTFTASPIVDVSRGSVELTGLENGTEYEIRAIAVDAVGNTSPPSKSARGTPVLTSGFAGEYSKAGGLEQGGGCSVGMGGLGTVSLFAAWALMRSRRRRP
jgi:hypothetical protein